MCVKNRAYMAKHREQLDNGYYLLEIPKTLGFWFWVPKTLGFFAVLGLKFWVLGGYFALGKMEFRRTIFCK